jgi:hypothetical protein
MKCKIVFEVYETGPDVHRVIVEKSQCVIEIDPGTIARADASQLEEIITENTAAAFLSVVRFIRMKLLPNIETPIQEAEKYLRKLGITDEQIAEVKRQAGVSDAA